MSESRYSEAQRFLARRDAVMKRLIKQHGDCTIAPRTDYFLSLCSAIVSQQLSVKAADTIWNRFAALFPRKKPMPDLVLTCEPDVLRSVGLSQQKASYLKNIAAQFQEHRYTARTFAGMSDVDVITNLTEIKGVGQWTAEMFLMFTLARQDVFSIGDLGLRNAMRNQYGHESNDEMLEHTETWKPYRTVASWYLWRSLEN